MIQRPVAIGLLLCEQVIVEDSTRNLTPVNCFSRRVLKDFPSEPLSFVVFVVLTDGMGKMNLAVVIQELGSLEVIHERVIACHFTNPLQEARGIIRVHCSFPKPGHYQVSLLAEKELVAQRKLILLQGDNP